jgi:hypothetical protein
LDELLPGLLSSSELDCGGGPLMGRGMIMPEIFCVVPSSSSVYLKGGKMMAE